MKRRLPPVVHPLLFALLPVVSLLSYNVDDMPPVQALRPAILVLAGTLLLWLVFYGFLKDWERAGLLVSLFLILFFSYGHVNSGLLGPGVQKVVAWLGLSNRHDRLLLVWLGLLVLFVAIVARLKEKTRLVTQMFNLMALVALVPPLMRIASYEWQLNRPWPGNDLAVESTISPSYPPPDIYYIILDGYGREDILQDFMGYDNGEFLDDLRGLGFYIADRSRSNYTQTSLSLASSLNMYYLDALVKGEAAHSADRIIAARLLRWSNVQRFLEERGYTTIDLASGYRLTELEGFDQVLRPSQRGSTWLDRLLVDTSLLVVWQDLAPDFGLRWEFPGYAAHRATIRGAFEALPQVANQPGPKFVFAHIIMPHPPFVFDAAGNAQGAEYPFTLMDGDAYPGTPDDYEQRYRQQLIYTNKLTIEAVRGILENSARPPVIVIQGDHGPGSRFHWDKPLEPGVSERLAILNAYYLPDVSKDTLYEDISPVNTFRLIFNEYLGANLPLLADRSYFSTWGQPYQFVDIK
jgi:hypothetical protein